MALRLLRERRRAYPFNAINHLRKRQRHMPFLILDETQPQTQEATGQGVKDEAADSFRVFSLAQQHASGDGKMDPAGQESFWKAC